jgi:predicted DNA-binding transcriptional regulator AlpA
MELKMQEQLSNPQNQLDRYLSDNEICKTLGKSRPTLWRWRRQGNFPAAHRLGVNSNGTPLSIFLKWQADKASQVGSSNND